MGKIMEEDTIAAIATPVGEGGLAVIRISGAGAFSVAAKVFRPAGEKVIEKCPSHTVHFGKVVDAEGRILDQGLIALFRNPSSYTGEDVAELSIHGGVAVTRKILQRILDGGARLAAPGEFTKRAFLNGKIDLTQAEAVVDLIRAKSDRSVQVALKQLEGALSSRFRSLRERLMKIYAHMEAFIDFPDEDIEIYTDEAFRDRFREAEKELEELIAGFKRGALLREGITCVIAGRPNVGKSSLFNALLERDRALVSEWAGTTRDMLEESVEIAGVYIRLMDTAGLGLESDNPLDKIGMERTRRALDEARIILYVVDSSAELEEGDRTIFHEIKGRCPVLVILNKCDKASGINHEKLRELTGTEDFISLSTLLRTGLADLEKQISGVILEGRLHPESEQITRLRHRDALERSLKALQRTGEAFDRRESLDLVTLDLKEALDSLSELIGEVYSEDLLDVIFSEFCIGK